MGLIVLALLLCAGVLVALVQVATLDSRLAQDQGKADKTTRQLSGQLNAQNSSINGMARHLSSLDAKVNATPDPSAIARAVSPSVYTLNTSDQSSGTAWVASTSGSTSLLITNFHVVADEWNNGGRDVTVVKQNETFTGTISTVSPGDDLAGVTVDQSLPVLPRDSTTPTVGDPVLVVGSPLGLGGSVSTGIVSALRTLDGVSYIQFSAPISPGNSGSPVVNAAGKVIGVAEAKAVGNNAEGIGFAIPVDELCSSGLSC